MSNAIGSITRAATRGDDPLNILTFPTHERNQSFMAATGHKFWCIRGPNVKDWNTKYAPLPNNIVLFNPDKGERQIPPELDFDLVLSQNKFGQYQIAKPLSQKFHLPLVNIEHTLPHPSWSPSHLNTLRTMQGNINVFITDYSRKAWGWDESNSEVVYHGLDTNLFSPNTKLVAKKHHILSVCNDWKNRDWCCGFEIWKEITQGLAVSVVGDTPGLSKPAASVHELVMKYRESPVFLNTSLISPIPTSLLEAMSCGLACVSTNNCAIPEAIKHGENGFLGNTPQELRSYCQLLLNDSNLCEQMGKEARKTVLEKFSLESFVDNWNSVFRKAADFVFVGS